MEVLVKTIPKPTRNRRLRKKLHVDEFQELGFYVSFRFVDKLDASKRDNFLDAFIVDAIEANDLIFGGSDEGGFVAGDECKSATELHRDLVKAWLSARSEVVSVSVGPLVDAWYLPDEE